jgi:hypothetical protein
MDQVNGGPQMDLPLDEQPQPANPVHRGATSPQPIGSASPVLAEAMQAAAGAAAGAARAEQAPPPRPDPAQIVTQVLEHLVRLHGAGEVSGLMAAVFGKDGRIMPVSTPLRVDQMALGAKIMDLEATRALTANTRPA